MFARAGKFSYCFASDFLTFFTAVWTYCNYEKYHSVRPFSSTILTFSHRDRYLVVQLIPPWDRNNFQVHSWEIDLHAQIQPEHHLCTAERIPNTRCHIPSWLLTSLRLDLPYMTQIQDGACKIVNGSVNLFHKSYLHTKHAWGEISFQHSQGQIWSHRLYSHVGI